MKIKIFLLIFLSGLLLGVSFSPFAIGKPEQALISPISSTQAKEFISPLATNVLGEKTMVSKKIVKKSQFAALINQSVSLKIKEKAKVKKIKKRKTASSYQGKITIVAVGDSITDLMGENLPYLKNSLQKYYPQADLHLYNYGVGAQNIEQGLARIKHSYHYKGKEHLPLAALNPDLVIVESFAYNPFVNSEGETDRHWSDLAKIVDFVKNNTKAKIIMLASLSPAKAKFGKGPNGVNWPPDLAWRQAERINQYLENTVRFSNSANLPLVDVYHRTLLANGEGNPAYINSGDHIHQNINGNKLMASLLSKKIFNLSLF